MPATYTHRYTYEQLTGNGRNTRKKPEPVSNASRIFGYDVDYATFRKYNSQTYTVRFCLCDLASVERWATDPELARSSPEAAAEAKQIMNRIIAEITGKDDKNMKTPKTSSDFITALSDLYDKNRSAYTEAEKKLKTAEDAKNRAEKRMKEKGTDLAAAEFSVAKGQCMIAQDEFRKTIRNIQDEHHQEVAELRNQFAAFLDDHYSASPEKLDNATLALLNSGICSPAELAKLAERHANNPTMLRIVSGHAEKMRNRRNQSDSDYKLCTQVAMMASTVKNGNRELAIFDSAVGAAERGLQTDAGAAGRMHGHITGWFGDFKTQVENLPNVPNAEG